MIVHILVQSAEWRRIRLAAVTVCFRMHTTTRSISDEGAMIEDELRWELEFAVDWALAGLCSFRTLAGQDLVEESLS
jgi:hypothetical protein